MCSTVSALRLAVYHLATIRENQLPAQDSIALQFTIQFHAMEEELMSVGKIAIIMIMIGDDDEYAKESDIIWILTETTMMAQIVKE